MSERHIDVSELYAEAMRKTNSKEKMKELERESPSLEGLIPTLDRMKENASRQHSL